MLRPLPTPDCRNSSLWRAVPTFRLPRQRLLLLPPMLKLQRRSLMQIRRQSLKSRKLRRPSPRWPNRAPRRRQSQPTQLQPISWIDLTREGLTFAGAAFSAPPGVTLPRLQTHRRTPIEPVVELEHLGRRTRARRQFALRLRARDEEVLRRQHLHRHDTRHALWRSFRAHDFRELNYNIRLASKYRRQ